MRAHLAFLAAASLALATAAMSQTPGDSVDMRQISDQGVGESIGTVNLSGGSNGVIMALDLKGLPPGEHGFHMHENPNCDPADKDGKMTAGEAAGPHFDPAATKSHQGPEGKGHAGDLPKFEVAADGTAKAELVAPHLKLVDMKGRTLMIHAGGDTYSDEPPLGGGGARIACGIVQ
jgi:superoxide dismutase, Cu-Zn family